MRLIDLCRDSVGAEAFHILKIVTIYIVIVRTLLYSSRCPRYIWKLCST